MSPPPTSPLVLVADGAPGPSGDAWQRFAHEVLGHLRLSRTTTTVLDPDALPPRGLVVLARPPRLSEAARRALLEWLEAGSAVVVVGGPGDLDGPLGITVGRTVAAGHVEVLDADLAGPVDGPLRAFAGVTLDPSDEWDVVARWHGDGAVAWAHRRWGAGSVTVVGLDAWQTIVRILQGWPVVEDGTPAADGSAPVDDGILKCDDGVALDYRVDRRQPPTATPLPDDGYDYVFPVEQAAPLFDRPQADIWRRLLFGSICRGMAAAGVPATWVDYWPDGIEAIVHVSLDSDGNDDAHAAATLDLLHGHDLRVTWCHQFPGGYGQQVLDAIGRAGHEHALHYNALGDADGAEWGEARFRDQLDWLRGLLDGAPVVSNKNHFTRWEGWSEFFLWCERAGIEVDESRGGSKPGNAGFAFGTSHPWFPMAPVSEHSRPVDVLAVPLHTQDLTLVAHESIRDVLLDQAQREHGLAHFLFHPTHLASRDHVRGGLDRLVSEVRARGLPIWTCARINRWHRARRGVDLVLVERDDGSHDLEVRSTSDIEAITCLVAKPDADVAYECRREDGTSFEPEVVTRHGHRFLALPTAVPRGTTTLHLHASTSRADDGAPGRAPAVPTGAGGR